MDDNNGSTGFLKGFWIKQNLFNQMIVFFKLDKLVIWHRSTQSEHIKVIIAQQNIDFIFPNCLVIASHTFDESRKCLNRPTKRFLINDDKFLTKLRVKVIHWRKSSEDRPFAAFEKSQQPVGHHV